MAGGVLADAALALNVILARLYWKNGKLPIPHFYDKVRKLTAKERRAFKTLPGDEAKWRKDLGILPGVHFANEKKLHPYEQTWRKPAVTIIAQEASSIKGASNQVLPKASAIVSCRIVPDQDPDEVFEQAQGVPDEDPPWGVKVTVKPHGDPVKWWMTDPNGPAFEAALKAHESRLWQEAGGDRLRRHHRFRRPAGGTVRRRAGPAAGHRGSAEQRPRPQREPARRRLPQADGVAGPPVREPRQPAG